MAERKITYTLDFQADVNDASSQLDKLGHSLQSLASRKLVDGHQFDEAADAALRMKGHLDKALDPSTGKLDLTRLATSMKNAGDTAQSLGKKFATAGAEGNKAFLQVANAVANAQPSIVRTSKLMNNLWISLKNTAKWQISSSILSGFTSSLSSAVSFAKQLNKSLNDIRIVSGDSADEMARFAKEANKMAKEIGASTTDIVKGTLIYRQQGDTAEEAAQKAEITSKAAAITTESTAEEMSEYLTGIWNSYQVGSDQLELFVDKLAYVGATTATSMEEIATSMTKVAATANTVGVEYEQLLGIIATVSSATRISAEQVGTAYKTILARMGDLKLEGSIDEEGITVTLGDVSSTLKQVGIEVLDANNDLRDMGVVIEEVGNGWDNFTKAEKAAIAEALAGKRQYTQLFALFENWNEYEKSVKGAAEAQGTLNDQHKIYLESWEASSDRIKANLEDITMDMYSDKGILTLMNGFADILGFIDRIIEGMGGFGPLLLMTGSIATKVFNQQIGSGLENIWTNLLILGGKGETVAQKMRTQFETTARNMANSMSGGFSQIENAQSDFIVELLEFQNKYSQSYEKMSDSTRQLVEYQKQLAMEGFTEAQTSISGAQRNLRNYQGKTNLNYQGHSAEANAVKQLKSAYQELNIQFDASEIDIQELIQVMSQSKMTIQDVTNIIELFGDKLNITDDDRENFIEDIKRMKDGLAQLRDTSNSIKTYGDKLPKLEDRTLSMTDKITHLSSGLMAVSAGAMSVNSAFDTLTNDTATIGDKIGSLGMTIPMVSMNFIGMAKALKDVGMAGKALTAGTWIGLVLMLAPALIKFVDSIIPSTKNAIKAAEKANNEYQKSVQELENINNTLDEKKRKLEEINKLEKTPENTQEIDNLKIEIGLLEYQLELEQKINKEKEKEKTKTADNAAEKLLKQWDKTSNKIQQDANNSNQSEFGVKAFEIGDRYNTLYDAMFDEEGIVKKLQTQMENASPEIQKLIDEQIKEIEAQYEEAKIEKEALDIYNKETEKETDPSKLGKERYDAILNEAKARAKNIKLIEEQIELEKKQSQSISNTVEKLKDFDDEFDATNMAIDEFKEKGKLSYDTIVTLQEAFGTADEELNKMYEGLANGTVGLEEFKNKVAEVIEEQFVQKILTGELNGLNQSMTEAYLKSKGVTNAATVAQKAYNLALVQQEAATISVYDRTGQLTQEFLALAKTSKLTEAQLLELTLQEKILNNSKLSFKEKIQQLASYAGAAKLAGLELVNLGKIQNAIVGKKGKEHLSEEYILGTGRYEKVNSGTKKNDASDNQYREIATGAILKHEAVQEKETDMILGSNDTKINLNISGGNLSGTPNDGDGKSKEEEEDKPEIPESVDWISILLRDIAYRNIGYIEDTIKVHEEELDLLDEEKGQIDEIIAKQNELLFLNRLKQEGYKNQIAEQNSLLDRTISQLTPQFDRDTVLSWFDSEGEQSDVFGDLLESQGMNIEAREHLEEVWDNYKLIIDAIKEANEGLRETQLEEPKLVDDIYNSEIRKIDLELERLEDINKSLEDSAYMDYEHLRKNYGIMQDFYKKQYEMAKATGREADARKYLALWWEKEAEIVKSVSDEYDDIRSNYDLIAEELKRRQEEYIEEIDEEIKKQDELIELYDYKIQRLQYTNTLQQSYNNTLNNLFSTQHEIDKELRNSMLSEKYLSEIEKEKIFNAKDYLIITEEIAEIQEDIEKSYIKYQEEIEELEDEELYRAELLTKEFEAQAAEKQRALEILKLEIDLTKKRNALTETLQEKNVRIYQGGQWIQAANFKNVQAAADALAETEYQIAEKKRINAQEEEKTRIELEIAEMEEKKSEIEQRKKNLEELKEIHEEEIQEIEDMTKVLDDAKTKWETGFDATATSAKDLADAFNDAMETLEDEFGSSYSKVRKDTTSGLKITNSFSPPSPSITLPKPVSINKGTTTYKYTGNKATAGPLRTYASGTNDTLAGPAKVNEEGLELYATSSGQFIELNPHGKIFNNEQFNYLYALSRGKTSIDANGKMGAITIGQMTLALPHVTDVQSFAEGLKHLNEYIRNTKNF